MNGRLALYRDQYGIVPVAVSLAAILWTTMVLTAVQSNFVADDPEGLALAYLLPTIFIAVFFGSSFAVASSFASGLAAAYFIYPPKFSLFIADPRHIAELGFILLLAVTASKAVGVLIDDKPPATAGGVSIRRK
jgi:K+-sensing histidine kinase KdpD